VSDDAIKRQQIRDLHQHDLSVLCHKSKDEEEDAHTQAVIWTVHKLLFFDSLMKQQFSMNPNELQLWILTLKTNSFTISDGESTPI
jgi:hypothetical protein